MRTFESRQVRFRTQGEWREWRRDGIGASDIVIIRGKSRFQTRTQLLMNKIARIEQPLSDYLMRQAANREDEARNYLNKHLSMQLSPLNVVSLRNPDYRASLDSYCPKTKCVHEHKAVGRKVFNELENMDLKDELFIYVDDPSTLKQKSIHPFLEQIVWQCGVVGRVNIKLFALTVSLIEQSEPQTHIFKMDVKCGRKIRKHYRRQTASAQAFVKQWRKHVKARSDKEANTRQDQVE